jgi:Tol biopolymer transport system component
VVVEEGNLTQQIFLLRKALEDSADGQVYIATIPRVGYRFVADVTEYQGPDPHSARGGGARRWVAIAAIAAIAVATVGFALVVARRDRGSGSAPQLTFTQLTADPGVESFPSVAPDGQSFVYARGPIDYEGESDIYLRRVGSERGVNLTPDSPGADTQPVLSADGLQIAFRSERSGGGIFRMRISGESVQRVTDVGYNPSWSPDGTLIAYSTLRMAASPGYRTGPIGEIWIVDVASGARTRVARADAVQPCWSPHGHRIAYWGTDGVTKAIYTVPRSGGEPVPVAGTAATRGGEFVWNPVWSPDGRYLYFSSSRSGSMNVWRIPMDETTGSALGPPEPITLPTTFAAHLSFSARGDRLVFASLPTRASIQRIGLDPARGRVHGEPVVVTKDSHHWVWPEPSPDGRFLAFHSGGLRSEDIYVSAADGSDLRQLTHDPAADRVARWSPDGRRIAFYSARSGHWNIWTVNADGSDLRQVTYFRDARLPSFPAWSPDGTRMSVNLSGGEAFMFDPSAPWDEHNLQFFPRIDRQHFTPWSWSQDGRAILGSHAGGRGIVIYTLATRTYESIATFGSTPVWLNDNRRVIFAFQNRLFIVDRVTKSPSELFSFGEGRVQMAAGGGFSVTRDSRTIYATPVIRDGDIWMATMR